MVKRLLPGHLRFSRRPLYGFFPHLQRVSGRVEKKKSDRAILKLCSRQRPELEATGKGINAVEAKDKTLELVNKGRNQLVRNETISEVAAFELPGIPLAHSEPDRKSGVTFVLEQASLVCAKVGRRYQILNSNEHAAFLRKKNKNPYKYRPDIIHEVLSRIIDSRLCKSGRIQAIYVKTDEGVLIKVEPNTHIPRTPRRFRNMMAELLQKLSVKAANKHGKLLRLVQNPVTQHPPANSRKIGLSYSSNQLVRLKDYVGGISDNENLVFVVGAMAHGKIDADYVDDLISIYGGRMSARMCLEEIFEAVESKWKIL
ncbi:Ribosomal biogenesis [Theobroma cacao]|nr:Ribosomal biogenesis [Theobroma cacao]